MQPIKSTDFGIQFGAQWSPLWLLLLLPLLIGIGWYFYRSQAKDVARFNLIGLTVLRCVILVVLGILVFQPSLVKVDRFRFPGRVGFVVDDSRSMSVPDPDMPISEALELARFANMLEQSENDVPCYHVGRELLYLIGDVSEFERYSKKANRNADRFWDRVEKFQSGEDGVKTKLDKLTEVFDKPKLREEIQNTERASMAELKTALSDLKDQLKPLTTGEDHPGTKVFEKYIKQLRTVADLFFAAQRAIDKNAVAKGEQRLLEIADTVRETSRYDLIKQILTQYEKQLQERFPEQYSEKRFLSADGASLETLPEKADASKSPVFDVVKTILEEQHDFPLTSLFLLSDGRDTLGETGFEAGQVAARKQVPVCSLGAGTPNEPADAAVLDVVTPPVGIVQEKTVARVSLKLAFPKNVGQSVKVVLKNSQGEAIEEKTVEVKTDPIQNLEFVFKPVSEGVFEYQVEVISGFNEVVPKENNSAGFALRVRKQPVRVLFVDREPRWETRFILNVLQRLNYISLNQILTIANEDGELERGAEPGQWPVDMAGLAAYDLLMIGDVDTQAFKEEDWDRITRFVTEKSGMVAFVTGNAESEVVKVLTEKGLYPTDLPEAEGEEQETVEQGLRPADFRTTPWGQFHPLTRGLVPSFGTMNAEDANFELKNNAVPLLYDQEKTRTILSIRRFDSGGRVFALESDQLWKDLNPTDLDAHIWLYVNTLTWLVDNAIQQDATVPQWWIPQKVAQQGQTVLAIADSEFAGETIEVKLRGEVIDEVQFDQPDSFDNGLTFAPLEDLPAGQCMVSIKERAELPPKPLMVTALDKELKFLSRDVKALEELARYSGSESVPFYRGLAAIQQLNPKERIEETRKTYRLWDSLVVMLGLVVALSVEWIWRKFAGLI